MLHLLAVTVQSEYYLNIFKCNNISKEFEFEKDSEGKSKTSENDNFDSENDIIIENNILTKKCKNSSQSKEDILLNNFQFSEKPHSLVYITIPIPPPDTKIILS
jgi:hypothetical protein